MSYENRFVSKRINGEKNDIQNIFIFLHQLLSLVLFIVLFGLV